MDFENVIDYVQSNTYKVVRSNYPQHQEGKLFILDDSGNSVFKLYPVDYREDSTVFKLSLGALTDNGYALENEDIRLEAICNFNQGETQ